MSRLPAEHPKFQKDGEAKEKERDHIFELKFLNELFSENMAWLHHSETYILVQEFCLFL